MMILVWVIIGFGIYYLLTNKEKFELNSSKGKSSLEVLNQRYANGETDDEAYLKMKKIINE